MTIRLLSALAAVPVAAVSVIALAGPASATGEVCYENEGSFCPEPTPTDNDYNLILGTRGADTIFGTFRDDAIFGFRGDDRIAGRFGDDLLLGGRGNDTLLGGFGVDTMRGGRGVDTCIGDTEDRFLSCENVVITG